MNLSNVDPGLFGIVNSNKDFTDPISWGKNQFNNAFPASLACFMDSESINPRYLKLDSDKHVLKEFISVKDVFGISSSSPGLFFSFESQFTPFAPIVFGTFDNIDLVTVDISNENSSPLMGLEIKLTAIPDSTTVNSPLNSHGTEIVVRPQTIFYLAMRIAVLYKNERKYLSSILTPLINKVSTWDEISVVRPHLSSFVEAIDEIIMNKVTYQSPFLLQPIWRTVGDSVILNEECFDLFVWSDFSFTRLFIDSSKESPTTKITRPSRTVFWLALMLEEFSRKGKFNPRQFKDSVTLGTGNDKAFALSGSITNPYMNCHELMHPRINKNALKEIILGNGYKYLKPERRLDAAILMTPGIFN